MNPIQEDQMFVEFYSDAVELTHESEREGRPIYKEMPHVKIMIPGDPHNIIERRATDVDKQKYPKAWARFERMEAAGQEGTPLEAWPQINRAQVKEAKYFEVHTVEAMAGLSDSHCMKMGMGFTELRTKAKAYLTAAKDTAAATAQAAENERLHSLIADLQAQIKEQSKRGPGRPPKETAEA
ncbi:hypothetical protein [Achromobacter aegrifaciens]|uniref:hypothetical protein n=1 Tax=Achromobacter aegrifaciens TaxID=1287736 RepID=UPI00320A92F1